MAVEGEYVASHMLRDQSMSSSSLAFADCPKPKKSKTSKEHNEHGNNADVDPSLNWSHLPSVLFYDIFSYLSREDRKNASAVCKHWRHNSFHPKLWQDIMFEIKQQTIDKARFQIEQFSTTCCNAKIKLDPLSHLCINEFSFLLKNFHNNTKLKSIILEPTHCHFEEFTQRRLTKYNVFAYLKPNLGNLNKFSIGCLEDLSYYIDDILLNLDPDQVTHLGLASMKYDLHKYQPTSLNPQIISPFIHLRVLSVDYDNVSDNLLSNLQEARKLERLVVHLHQISEDHPGTTNDAWVQFRRTHPRCELRLTVVHAFVDILNLHQTVMRPAMPLTHFRAFFCEMVNLNLVDDLTAYSSTLRSVMWIDSLNMKNNYYVYNLLRDNPDPFVLMAWLCRKLEEFVFYGYKYIQESLVAIGRLREGTLKRLEVLEEDVVYDKRVKEGFEKTWMEVKTSDVHLVVRNPAEGDSDEFMLPIVLADLDLS